MWLLAIGLLVGANGGPSSNLQAVISLLKQGKRLIDFVPDSSPLPASAPDLFNNDPQVMYLALLWMTQALLQQTQLLSQQRSYTVLNMPLLQPPRQPSDPLPRAENSRADPVRQDFPANQQGYQQSGYSQVQQANQPAPGGQQQNYQSSPTLSYSNSGSGGQGYDPQGNSDAQGYSSPSLLFPGTTQPQGDSQGYPPQSSQGYSTLQSQGYPAQGYPGQSQGYPAQTQGYPAQSQAQPQGSSPQALPAGYPQDQNYPETQAQGYPQAQTPVYPAQPQTQAYPGSSTQGYSQAQGYPPQSPLGYPPQSQAQQPPSPQGYPGDPTQVSRGAQGNWGQDMYRSAGAQQFWSQAQTQAQTPREAIGNPRVGRDPVVPVLLNVPRSRTG